MSSSGARGTLVKLATVVFLASLSPDILLGCLELILCIDPLKVKLLNSEVIIFQLAAQFTACTVLFGVLVLPFSWLVGWLVGTMDRDNPV